VIQEAVIVAHHAIRVNCLIKVRTTNHFPMATTRLGSLRVTGRWFTVRIFVAQLLDDLTTKVLIRIEPYSTVQRAVLIDGY
jgi:hypothetical protein